MNIGKPLYGAGILNIVSGLGTGSCILNSRGPTEIVARRNEDDKSSVQASLLERYTISLHTWCVFKKR